MFGGYLEVLFLLGCQCFDYSMFMELIYVIDIDEINTVCRVPCAQDQTLSMPCHPMNMDIIDMWQFVKYLADDCACNLLTC